MGKIERIEISSEDREELRRLVRDRNTPQKVVWRARIVLLAGNGIGAGCRGRSRRERPHCAPLATSLSRQRRRGPSERRDAAGSQEAAFSADDQQGRKSDPPREAPKGDALEPAFDGESLGRLVQFRATHLESARAQTASCANIQAVARS